MPPTHEAASAKALGQESAGYTGDTVMRPVCLEQMVQLEMRRKKANIQVSEEAGCLLSLGLYSKVTFSVRNSLIILF